LAPDFFGLGVVFLGLAFGEAFFLSAAFFFAGVFLGDTGLAGEPPAGAAAVPEVSFAGDGAFFFLGDDFFLGVFAVLGLVALFTFDAFLGDFLGLWEPVAATAPLDAETAPEALAGEAERAGDPLLAFLAPFLAGVLFLAPPLADFLAGDLLAGDLLRLLLGGEAVCAAGVGFRVWPISSWVLANALGAALVLGLAALLAADLALGLAAFLAEPFFGERFAAFFGRGVNDAFWGIFHTNHCQSY